ncbi:alpha/beta fold hydrolase [Nonomuraea sp. NPDC050540]|uniref:alpha/beta fold hydrolase n=1 Tax=Nonomuraea sp. NPDC050540 TaxID=3364367 RepID=UPI0037B14193
MITNVVALTLLTTLLPGAPAPASAQPGTHECAGATTRCDGSVQVPLDWDDPASQRISVAFAFIPAKNTADGTIVANPGGPGPVISTLDGIQDSLGPVLKSKNLLLMDPRGIGESSRLVCEGAALDKPETIAPCAKKIGPKAAYYTADQASHDLEAVRRALGLGRVSYYGNSYGTVFAQAYAAHHPRSLDAIFLDSTVVVEPTGYASWEYFTHSQMTHLDTVCDRSKECAALPGKASGIWTRLVERLRRHPDPAVSVFQTYILRNVERPLYGREATAAADAYLRGDTAPLYRLARDLPTGLPTRPDPDFAGYLAFRCGDGAFPFDRHTPGPGRRAQAERYYQRERPLAPYEVTDIYPGFDTAEPCIDWPTPRHSPVRPPGQTPPSIPVLAMAGELDFNGGPGAVARSLRAFPNVSVLTVPFGDHALTIPPSGPGAASHCARETLRAFLATKRVTDQGCTAENYRAVGRFPRRLADVAPHRAPTLTTTQQRVLAAVLATAADATARRNPNIFPPSTPNHPGLRGGQLTLGADITLTQLRYVEDVQVTGTIALTSHSSATATLRAETGGRTHEVTLAWNPFTTDPKVAGTFDGASFGYFS